MLLMVCGLLAGTMMSHARVYRRWGSSAQGDGAIKGAGGKTVYEADMTINSGKGHVTVYSFKLSIGEVVASLRRIFGADNLTYEGGTMGKALILSKSTATRLIVFGLGTGRSTIVVRLEQSVSEFKRSSKPPLKLPVKSLPSYPGSELLFFAKDEKTSTSFAVSTAPSNVSSARSFLTSRLVASGWKPTIPAKSDNMPAPGMTVYLKNREVCCLFVSSSSRPGESRITLLHKRSKIK